MTWRKKTFENIVEIEEKAANQHFPLFQNCLQIFQNRFSPSEPIQVKVSSASTLGTDSSKIFRTWLDFKQTVDINYFNSENF